MNLGKLSKRLRKELLANPKQAAVLAIVCLVAIWFWSPLLLKWFKGKAKDKVALKPEPTAPEIIAAKAESQHAWYDVHNWRKADPLTRSALLPEDARDPFQSPKPVVVAKQDEPQDGQPNQAIAAAPVQPDKLKLTLEAIVYGGARHLAQINGQAVQVNDELVLGGGADEGEGKPKQIVGRVVAIHPTEVLLDVGGNSTRLRLQPKLLGSGEVLKRARTQ